MNHHVIELKLEEGFSTGWMLPPQWNTHSTGLYGLLYKHASISTSMFLNSVHAPSTTALFRPLCVCDVFVLFFITQEWKVDWLDLGFCWILLAVGLNMTFSRNINRDISIFPCLKISKLGKGINNLVVSWTCILVYSQCSWDVELVWNKQTAESLHDRTYINMFHAIYVLS